MNKFELKEDIKVYRGLTDITDVKNLKIGDEFSPNTFYSTSVYKNIADEFMAETEDGDLVSNGIMLEIDVPKKTKCLYIGNISEYEGEHELLLHHNLRYKVIDIVNNIFRLEVVK